jgi:hypothetical protein
MNQIKKIIQDHAKKCMAMECDYDLYEETALYEHIAFNYCDTFEQEHQEYIYPSIIRHYSSKELTAIHNKFGLRRRRSMYDTIVSAIMLEAELLRMKNIRIREYQQVQSEQPPNAFEQPPNA